MKFLNKNFDELEIFAQSKKDEYIGDLSVINILNEIHSDDELAIIRISNEIKYNQKKSSN